MAKHFIDVFSFQFWRSPPPQTVQYQGESFTRLGEDVIGKVLTGKRGRPFEAIVEEHYIAYQLAMGFVPLYHALPWSGPVRIVYNDIDYLAAYSHLYFVDAVEIVECRATPRLVGPDYDYLGGARMVVRWQLTPFFIEPETEEDE